jgi:DNA polymerase/3'-5' exonuclease PolX
MLMPLPRPLPTNAEIADSLANYARVIEHDPTQASAHWRVRAARRAAAVICRWPVPVAPMSRSELMTLPGVGKGIARHVQQIVEIHLIPDSVFQ